MYIRMVTPTIWNLPVTLGIIYYKEPSSRETENVERLISLRRNSQRECTMDTYTGKSTTL